MWSEYRPSGTGPQHGSVRIALSCVLTPAGEDGRGHRAGAGSRQESKETIPRGEG